MSYEIRLEVFEGPLDLLLHLIHRNEVSITDIPVALITAQYLETIDLMKSLNLDVAGEYLVMAAYLTHIKSQMLLPVPDPDPDQESDHRDDPREELVSHLLEYKRYKEAARSLDAMPMLERDQFAREPVAEPEDAEKPLDPLAVSMGDLLAALKDLLARTSRRDLIEVQPERLLVQDRMREILRLLEDRAQISFESVFQADATRQEILTSFLALLELAKLRLVKVYQDMPFGTILIAGRTDSVGPVDMTGESDDPATGPDA